MAQAKANFSYRQSVSQNDITQSPEATQFYCDTKSAASYLGLSTQYLEIARHKGNGPKFIKLSRAVRYRRSDLDTWMTAQLHQHTGEYMP